MKRANFFVYLDFKAIKTWYRYGGRREILGLSSVVKIPHGRLKGGMWILVKVFFYSSEKEFQENIIARTLRIGSAKLPFRTQLER